MVKRCFDVLFASLGLILLSPAFLVIAALIKLDSPGPALFRQERVGLRGKVFRIHKFRTMSTGAEAEGMQITVGDDRRITRIGKLLRRFKLDELPQLIDVLCGDMSVVGPRPEVPAYVAHYPAEVRDIVLSIKPGITDWASIEFRDESALLASAEDPHAAYLQQVLPRKLAYYVKYAKERSLIVDLRIIAMTLAALCRSSAKPPLR
jgi:lipopolysaccharide/colanic/teichoic acid biosynthesis glycosyltransferase